MTTLLTESHWAGEFFPPNHYHDRFFGELTYSPENGVNLSYRITRDELPPESTVLHGVLSNGKKCSLIGQYQPALSGTTFDNGLITRPGEAFFLCLVIGDFLDPDETLAEYDFTLTNLQEFFYPNGFKHTVKYNENPLYSVSVPFGTIQVTNTARFGPLDRDISTHIYSPDSDALEDLKTSFNTVRGNNPNALFMIKKDISYRLQLKFSVSKTVRQALHYINELGSLFALLLFRPVYPETINATKMGSDDSQLQVELYPALVLDRRTIDLCTDGDTHWNLPISASTVDLNSLIENWFGSSRSYSTVISSIQNETGFRDEHSVHGEIVLFATQLESISHSDNSKNEKYGHPLRTYAAAQLQNEICKLFGAGTIDEVAIGISDLRNEIAHVGRPRKWLDKLSLRKLVDLSQILQLTISGYILNTICVPQNIILKYQERHFPST